MGELTTRKRGKTWEYGFEGARISGKRNRITKGGFRTKSQALEEGTKALSEYNRSGQSFEPSSMSVSDYIDYWLINHVEKNLEHNTYLDYDSKVRIHIKPYLGHYRLMALQSIEIQKWVDGMKDRGYARSMVSNTLACLSGALNYAIAPCRYIQTNPCLAVKVPRIAVDRRRKEHTDYICAESDFKKITDRFPEGSNFYLPLMVGYYLGTRIGETYGIDLIRDVDFDNHTISIRHQLKKEKSVWYMRPPKYGSYRTILMGATIENALKNELIRREQNILKYGPHYTKVYMLPDNSLIELRAGVECQYPEIMPLSVKENGNMLTSESFKHCARTIHHELGNVNFHYHCLRHTHGTVLAENGAHPKAVMERLGHKNINITLQTYTFNTDKMKSDTVDIFEKASSLSTT